MHQKQLHPVIDLFRGLACLWVLAHHASAPSMLPDFIKNIFGLGWLAAPLFFIVSGFLVFGLLSDANRPQSYRRFYIRRSFKIFPQYIMLIALIYMLHLMEYVWIPEATRIGYYIVFIQNYFPYIGPLAHTWTLCIEEWFYVSLPILVIAARYISGRWNMPLINCYIMILFLPVMFSATMRYLYIAEHGVFSPAETQTTHYAIGGIFYGCIFRCFLDKQVFSTPRNRCLGWVFIIITGSLFLTIVQNETNGWRTWYRNDLIFLCFGALLAVCYASKSIEFVCSRLRPLIIIGRNSYGIYIWHYPILILVQKELLKQPVIPALEWVYWLEYMAAAVMIGCLSTRCFESYFLKLRDKYYPA